MQAHLQQIKPVNATAELKRQVKGNIKAVIEKAFSNGQISSFDYEDRLSNLSSHSFSLGDLHKLLDNLNKQFRSAHANSVEATATTSANSYLHGDPSLSGQKHSHFFIESRKNHTGLILAYNKEKTDSQKLSVGEITDQQCKITYADSTGTKSTTWFARHRLFNRRKSIEKLGSHIHKIIHRDVIFDVSLTPENTLDRQVIEVIYL